jgi:Ca2+-binding RTX toxin-like protein
VIFGGRGADKIRGRRGDDLLCSGRGNDVVRGGRGEDLLRGGRGDEVLRGAGANDNLIDTRGKNGIDCGPGKHDVAITNKKSKVRNCEKVRRRQPAPRRTAGWTPPQSITPRGEAGIVPDLSLNRDGRAVAVWYREAANGELTMRGAIRRPGHGFGPPATIGQADQTSGNNPPSVPEVAISRSGDAIAVWLRKDDQGNLRVVSSFRPAGGEFGPVETLSNPGASAFDPQVAFAPSGRAIAVWARLVSPGQTQVNVAVRPPGQPFFGDPDPVSAAPLNSQFPQVGIGGGRAVIVWLASPPLGGNHVVQGSRLTRAGHVQPLQTVSEADRDADRPQLAVQRRTGEAVVAWTSFDSAGDLASEENELAFAPEGQLFRAPHQVPEETGLVGLLPRPGFDGSGRATLLFRNTLPAAEPGDDHMRTAVTRDGSNFAFKQTLASATGTSLDFFVEPSLSVAGSGGAAAVWVRGHTVRAGDIQAAVRAVGERRFGNTKTLTASRVGGESPSVAASDRIAIAVWARARGNETTGVVTSRYRGFSP